MNYENLKKEIAALIDGVPYEIANLANVSAALWQAMDRINWAGFYRMEKGKLVLGPFQGKPACIEIAVGRGVCGTAVLEKRTVLVEDVHQFPGHIACDSASNSEIVIPLHSKGKVIAVIDIDSPLFDRFSKEDVEGLSEFARTLEENIRW